MVVKYSIYNPMIIYNTGILLTTYLCTIVQLLLCLYRPLFMCLIIFPESQFFFFFVFVFHV